MTASPQLGKAVQCVPRPQGDRDALGNRPHVLPSHCPTHWDLRSLSQQLPRPWVQPQGQHFRAVLPGVCLSLCPHLQSGDNGDNACTMGVGNGCRDELGCVLRVAVTGSWVSLWGKVSLRSFGMLTRTHLPGSQHLSPLVPHSSGLNVLILKMVQPGIEQLAFKEITPFRSIKHLAPTPSAPTAHQATVLLHHQVGGAPRTPMGPPPY